MPKGNSFSPILHQFASIRFCKKPEKDDSGNIRNEKKNGNLNLFKKIGKSVEIFGFIQGRCLFQSKKIYSN